jgi:hypothetical protein
MFSAPGILETAYSSGLRQSTTITFFSTFSMDSLALKVA